MTFSSHTHVWSFKAFPLPSSTYAEILKVAGFLGRSLHGNSPPITLKSSLQQTVCYLDSELTFMQQQCIPELLAECVILHGPLEMFSETMEDSGVQWQLKKLQGFH